MADFNIPNVHYLETDSRGSKDRCIESPLPVAQTVIQNTIDENTFLYCFMYSLFL